MSAMDYQKLLGAPQSIVKKEEKGWGKARPPQRVPETEIKEEKTEANAFPTRSVHCPPL